MIKKQSLWQLLLFSSVP